MGYEVMDKTTESHRLHFSDQEVVIEVDQEGLVSIIFIPAEYGVASLDAEDFERVIRLWREVVKMEVG